MGLSWFKSGHWFKGFIASFQSKGLLNFIRNKFGIFCKISVTFNPCITGHFCNFKTVIQPITTSNTIKSTSKQTILETFCAPFNSFAWITQLAIDEERSTKTPATWITIKICQPISLAGMPHINTACNTTCLIGAAYTLTDLLNHWGSSASTISVSHNMLNINIYLISYISYQINFIMNLPLLFLWISTQYLTY